MKLVFVLLATLSVTGACTPSEISPTPIITRATADHITGYEFPTSMDPASRYMFYLHGKIIEDVGLPAVSPEFGEYEYAAILNSLESHGFVVISEQRSRDTDADDYAHRVVGQVGTLLGAGVPAGNITVVGASKGGYIAAMVSFLLNEPAVNYVLLATCHPDTVEGWKRYGMGFHGNVLAIRDAADLEYSGSCAELFRLSEGKGLGRHEELVLQLGVGHGLLFKPLDAWVVPTVQWASG